MTILFKYSQSISSFFRCDIGVKQGDYLSPCLLFAIYQNNLEQIFVEKYHHTALLIKKAGGQIEATAPPLPLPQPRKYIGLEIIP
jgi:hypothetical protein